MAAPCSLPSPRLSADWLLSRLADTADSARRVSMQADHGGGLKMRRTDTAASLISVSSPMCTCGHGIGTEAIDGADVGLFKQKKNYLVDLLNFCSTAALNARRSG